MKYFFCYFTCTGYICCVYDLIFSLLWGTFIKWKTVISMKHRHCCSKSILYFNFLTLSSPLKPPALDTGLCWPPLKGVFHCLCCNDNYGSRTSYFPIKLSREIEWKLPWTGNGGDSTPESGLLYADIPLLLISFHFKWFVKKIEAIWFSN